MNTKWITKLLLCTAVGGSLLFASCAPALDTAFPADEPVEEDLPLAEELELSLLAEPFPLEGDNAPALFPEAAFLDAGTLNMAAATQLMSDELSIPATFVITRPAEKLTTSFASYFITGTSDPANPVYYGSDRIERLGASGVFGVLVDLDMGTNTFTFSQGGESQTVTIVRTAASTGTAAIKEILQSSMSPAYMSGVKAGEKLSVGCIAPAGAEVTASYGGKTITLKQTKEDMKAGLPATFTGKISIDPDSYNPDTTEKGEEVRYTLNYNGTATEYKSTGLVYVAGKDSDIAIQVVGYAGFVYPDTSNLANFKEVVKAGARDYMVGQTNEYFQLSSGGFIPKAQVTIITGEVRVQNKLSDASLSRGSNGEKITFAGTRSPMYNAWIENDVFYLRLYNTSGTPGVSVGDSRLASSVSVSENEEESRVTYKFSLSGLVWGYDISFDGNNTILKWKYKPNLGGDSAPLNGMTILLDPGHGGTDPGALGLAGKTGPTEADVNLANALATRDKLSSLGAKVVLTRTSDDYVSLDDRLQMIETQDADLFISMHHNSIAENVDANKISGLEIYYHTALSKKASDNLMAKLSTGLGRTNRSVTQSYYRVTLLPYSPSMLLELGFMSHPLDYENAVDSSKAEDVAQAVADGVLATLK